MAWSTSKIIRIEAGRVGISVNDIRALLPLYGISDEEISDLVSLARSARTRSHAWWETYKDITTSQFRSFLSYEHAATLIRNFEPLVVPGLLQTADYTRQVIRNLLLEEDEVKTSLLLDLRVERQKRVLGSPEKRFHFILDQNVISRAVGTPSVMEQQIQHLIALGEDPRITIRILPFSSGMYRLFNTSYVIFEFPEGAGTGNALYIERSPDTLLVAQENPDEIPGDETASYYLEAFWELEQRTDMSQSNHLLEAARDEFST
jgi:hypothetical protein